MSRPRIVFAGTPEFSVPCLDALIEAGAEIAAVYCQPDRGAGRGRHTRSCPVKRRAAELDLEIRQPDSLKRPGVADALAALDPDLMVVVAYGQILPDAILSAPRCGCVNVHASLLPRWRGAAPIQRAIEAGDEVTGITLMQMDAGLDTGAILARSTTLISTEDTGATLHDRLSRLGADVLRDNLDSILAGRCRVQPQNDAEATYARKILRTEGRIDWREDAAAIERRIRAFDPWPMCRTMLDGVEIKIWKSTVASDARCATRPGTVLASGRDGVDVACGGGVLRLLGMQRAGGRRLEVGDFLNGMPIPAGRVMGSQ